MGVATVVLVVLLPMSWWIRACLAGIGAIAVTVDIVVAMRRDCWRITLSMDRRITVEHGGRERVGVVLDASYVTRDLTCIVWLEDGARLARAIPVPRDALSSEEHRRLRVALRYSRPGDEPPEGPGASAAAWLKGDLVA